MSISLQAYVIQLRAIYQQVEALTHPDGQVPAVPKHAWAQALRRAFRAVPELEEHWGEISAWVETMTTLLEEYHEVAGQLLQEEDTAKLPIAPLPEGP